jgi:FkbM family methyltransferase
MIKVISYLNFWSALKVFYHYIIRNKFSLKYYFDLISQLDNDLERIKSYGFECHVKASELIIKYQINKSTFKFYFGPSSSDFKVFRQIFIDLEYKSVIHLIGKIDNKKKINVIDIGANIGLSSIFFYANFPNSNIYAIEPDSRNYKFLEKNIKQINKDDNIHTMQRAIWDSSNKYLSISRNFRDGENWSRQTVINIDSFGEKIISISLSDLINYFKINGPIHLLKMDIEGTEFILFNSHDFIQCIKERVIILCLEIHEDVEAKDNIIRKLENIGFEYTRINETYFCINNQHV